MLKVVGASWLQTRITTYILITVILLGIGTIILCQFGHVEPDGIYSATVLWNRKRGYHIDFWGQSNDLTDVPLNAARAYYRTSILESGWSIIEIETSAKYPDTVQAYAAGLLEGSLTWQLIHHHWYNTIKTVCEKWATECQELMQYLRENSAIIRERAELLEATDPFWHMVRLFYIQLDGLEAGWKFSARRSRQMVEMDSDYFLWLAMAADLPDLERTLNNTDSHPDYSKGMIFLKPLFRKKLDPLIAIGHTTAAPYSKMLRLLKKYTFAYHLLPMPNTGMLVPGRSVVMSSYPGALSSQDEFYVMQGQNHELIVAGTPLPIANRGWDLIDMKDQVVPSVRLMVANRLAKNGRSWSHILFPPNGGSAAWQWVTLESRTRTVWLVEQLPNIFNTSYFTVQFADATAIYRTGKPMFNETRDALVEIDTDDDTRQQLVLQLQRSINTMDDIRGLMRGYIHEKDSFKDENSTQILTYRGDMEKTATPFGVIDAKIVLVNGDGIETFEATSGPSTSGSRDVFQWSKIFPNISHVGHPDLFDFDSVTPLWVWA